MAFFFRRLSSPAAATPRAAAAAAARAPAAATPPWPQPRASYQTFSLDSLDFPTLRARRNAYVDKTGAIADLLASDEGMLNRSRAFFARPRKFGKSLTLSVAGEMLAAGELPPGVKPWPGFRRVDVDACFGGLAVHERLRAGDAGLGGLLQRAHFVVKLGLGGAQTGAELKDRICSEIAGIAGAAFGDALEAKVRLARIPDEALSILLRAVPLGVPVAVLVDEYDAAIIQDVSKGRWAAADAGVEALRSLTMATKSPDIGSRIERCIVTGVARFAHTSLFSGANNFVDFSSSPLMSRVLGFSEAELRATFPAELERLGSRLRAEGAGDGGKGGGEGGGGRASASASASDSAHIDAAVAELARWYNGYCFDGASSSFNPFPVLQALRAGCITERELEAASGTNWLGLAPRAVFSGLASELLRRSSTGAGVGVVVDVGAANVNIADLEARRVGVVPLLLQTGLLSAAPGRPRQLYPPNEYARLSLQRMVATAMAVEHASVTRFAAALHLRDRAAFQAAAAVLLESVPRTIFKRAGSAKSQAKHRSEKGPEGGPEGGSEGGGAAVSLASVPESVYHGALFGALATCAPPGVRVLPQAPSSRGLADIVVEFGDVSGPGAIGPVWILELGVGGAPSAKLAQAQAYSSRYADEVVVLCCAVVAPAPREARSASQGGAGAAFSFAWSRRAQGGVGLEWTPLE
jgi:hypothetical protein